MTFGFLKLRKYEWHDILATLNVCAEKVHATKHYDEVGYDIKSLKTLSVIHEEESSDSRDESNILEGRNANISRIATIDHKDGRYVTKVMHYGAQIEISSFKNDEEIPEAIKEKSMMTLEVRILRRTFL